VSTCRHSRCVASFEDKVPLMSAINDNTVMRHIVSEIIIIIIIKLLLLLLLL
jgi:hypothetical protein